MEIINHISKKKIKNNNLNKKSIIRYPFNYTFFISIIILLFLIFILISFLKTNSEIFKIEERQKNLNNLEKELITIRKQNEQNEKKIDKNNLEFMYEKLARASGMKKWGEKIINLKNRNKFDEEANKLIENYEKAHNFYFENIKQHQRFSRIVISIIFILIFIFIIYRYFSYKLTYDDIPRYFQNEKNKNVLIENIKIYDEFQNTN